MLLQTNSYVVPRDKRTEHARLMKRFRQTLLRLGCDQFEVYEQVGPQWNASKSTGRFVQLIRFRDRKHHEEVQAAERQDESAQEVIREFCELVNFTYQQEQSLFTSGFYISALPVASARIGANGQPEAAPEEVIADSGDVITTAASDNSVG